MHEHERLRSQTLPVTPELADFVDQMLDLDGFSPDTSLLELRQAIFGQDLYLSRNGEFIFRLDRLSLVIELDELIDSRGGHLPARAMLPTEQGAMVAQG